MPALLEQAHSGAHKPLSLVERVDLTSEAIDSEIGPATLLSGLRLAVRARVRRRGVEQKLVIPGADSGEATRSADPALHWLIATSRHWFEAIASGRVASFKEIAEAEGVSDQFVSDRISLASLAPQIAESIHAGTQPADLTADAFVERIEIPLSWSDQVARCSRMIRSRAEPRSALDAPPADPPHGARQRKPLSPPPQLAADDFGPGAPHRHPKSAVSGGFPRSDPPQAARIGPNPAGSHSECSIVSAAAD